MKYKVISFDIFQTLVDVNECIPDIWQGILKEEYTKEKAYEGAAAIIGSYPAVYEKAVASEIFLTMEEVYTECAEKAVERLNFSVPPGDVAYHLMYQHSKAPFYNEALNCIGALHRQRKIILSSDSGHLMVDGLIGRIDCDEAFISDDLRCYKGDKEGRFFRGVLSRLDAEPQEILHIGDSLADIAGARRAGIGTCWINRDGRMWGHNIQPDYIVKDLNGLLNILS